MLSVKLKQPSRRTLQIVREPSCHHCLDKHFHSVFLVVRLQRRMCSLLEVQSLPCWQGRVRAMRRGKLSKFPIKSSRMREIREGKNSRTADTHVDVRCVRSEREISRNAPVTAAETGAREHLRVFSRKLLSSFEIPGQVGSGIWVLHHRTPIILYIDNIFVSNSASSYPGRREK